MNCNNNDYNNGDYNSMRRNNGQYTGFERMPVAMAYVPWQRFTRTYDLEQALAVGTIFPELNKPFTGRGGSQR